MANNLQELTAHLAVALNDVDHDTWKETEKQEVLKWVTSTIDLERPRVVREIVTLVTDTDQYSLATVVDVYRVDLLDEDDQMMMSLPNGTWELWGDGQTLGTLYVNPRFARTGWTLRVHGYASFDLTTNLPPSRMVPVIIASARAELLRRMIDRRADFKQWSTINQTANTSVNELIQMVNEADAEAARLRRELRIIHKPVPGRI